MDFVADNRSKVLVEDFFFLVGNSQKPLVHLLQLFLGQRISHLFEPVPQAVPAGSCRQNNTALSQPDRLGPHNLIRLALLQKSIHVNAGAVRERITSDNRFID